MAKSGKKGKGRFFRRKFSGLYLPMLERVNRVKKENRESRYPASNSKEVTENKTENKSEKSEKKSR